MLHRPPRAGRRIAAPPTDLLLLAAIGALAFAVRLQMAVRGGGLLGIGAYDDGVHYAAAASMIHGRVPYGDFLFLQPPGILLAASPFAALGAIAGDPIALRAFRVAFELVGALNAVLVAAVLRRWGRPAAIIGGVAYAVAFPAVYDERTALLEPLGNLGVLLALLLLGRVRRATAREALVAGLALGAACAFKIWYVVPALVVIASASGRRARVLLGAVVAGLVLFLPFLLLAPQAMIDQALLAQLGRARTAEFPDFFTRARVLLGVAALYGKGPLQGVDTSALTVVLLVLLAGAVLIALLTPGARVFAVLLVADGAVLAAAPSFYAHYAALVAPPLALLLGVAAGRAIGALPAVPFRAAAVVLVLLVVVGLNVRHDLDRVDIRPQSRELRAAAAHVPGCVVSDDPTLLAAMDVLSRDLAAGCPLRPDVGGYSFGPQRLVVDGAVVPRRRNPGYQRSTVDYLLSGAAFVRVRPNTGLDAASIARLRQQPVLRQAGGLALRAGEGRGAPR